MKSLCPAVEFIIKLYCALLKLKRWWMGLLLWWCKDLSGELCFKFLWVYMYYGKFLCNKSSWKRILWVSSWTSAWHKKVQPDKNLKATSKIFTWPALFALFFQGMLHPLTLFLFSYFLKYLLFFHSWPAFELGVSRGISSNHFYSTELCILWHSSVWTKV